MEEEYWREQVLFFMAPFSGRVFLVSLDNRRLLAHKDEEGTVPINPKGKGKSGSEFNDIIWSASQSPTVF